MGENLLNAAEQKSVQEWTDKHLHAQDNKLVLSNIRNRFATEYKTNHLGVEKGTPLNEVQKKDLDTALADFDKQAQERILLGAGQGAKPSELNKKLEATETKMKQGLAGALDKAIGWLTGGLSWVWDLVKSLPGIGDIVSNASDWVIEQTSGKKSNELTSEKRAAGAALALSSDSIIAGGYSFDINTKETQVLNAQFIQAQKEGFKAPTPPTTTNTAPTQSVPNEPNPNKGLPSQPPAQAKARQ